MSSVRANGLDLAYESHGRSGAPAVLLVMGLGRQLTAWPDELIAGLVDAGYRVIAFDNRDVGLSSKLESAGRPQLVRALLRRALRLPIKAPYQLSDMSADCAALLAALHIDRAHVIGVSMGGMIGQLFAGSYPESTASLTSIMSTSGARGLPDARPAARRALIARPPRNADLEQLVAHFVGVFRIIGSPGFPTPDELLRARFRISLRRSYYPTGVTRQLLAVLAAGDRSALLRRIRVPTLVIHGEDDPLVPVECGEDTARKITGARLVRVPGMGHDLAPGLVPILLEAILPHLEASSARRA
jgi:pimeloyl-ACP methyl ester carboxylesterase